MKYAILADIHANLPALQAVIRDSEAVGCERAVCLGDLVGYGQRPRECVELIRKWGIPCVKGNHDEYCCSDHSIPAFSPKVGEHIIWTREQLTDDDRNWLRALPYILKIDNFTIVHGSLENPERWGYVFEKLSAAASFSYQKTDVCFFGHTHVPVAFVRDTMVRGGTYSKFRVEHGQKYFINPGSVGQPRDGIRKWAYATYDLEKKEVELRRLDFDLGEDHSPPLAGIPQRPR
ncbi:MAG: metallophosphoesterase family protein [Verrucomicrobia bacterium]|nr:metallophosphoesterase family protein [Verrucomicrobiota bacterium]